MFAKSKRMANLTSTFEHLHTDLAETLVACRAHPDSNAVHRLRTSTRRIEALLRKVLDDHPRATRLRGKIKRALQQLRKVRRAAGPVRDLDVQRKLVAEITEKSRIVESIEHRNELSGECKVLDDCLHRRRKQSAAKLIKILKVAEPTLERALEQIPDAMANMHETSPFKTARRLVLDNSLDLNDVSGDRLHRYRKRTKAARYLAEMQKNSPLAQRLAKRLKRVLDDIGRWHDLMLLGQEAKVVLRKHSILTQAIKAERNRALSVATHSAGTMHQSR
jgi:CHAD domain-containing protein